MHTVGALHFYPLGSQHLLLLLCSRVDSRRIVLILEYVINPAGQTPHTYSYQARYIHRLFFQLVSNTSSSGVPGTYEGTAAEQGLTSKATATR